MNRRTCGAVLGLAIGCAVIGGSSSPAGADTPPAVCPGAKPQTPAATSCPTPKDEECSSTHAQYAPPPGPGRPPNNQACYETWKDHCACVNTARFEAARSQQSSTDTSERRPSPTKGVFPADAQNNSVHVRRYGIDTGLLTGNPPPVRGQKISTSFKGIALAHVSDPPVLSKKLNFFSKKHAGKAENNPKLFKTVTRSTQNRWQAHEVLARAVALGACSSHSGDNLIDCAKKYMRPLQGTPPMIGKAGNKPAPACEDFVYNRFYDIERWTDRTNACGHDARCRAAITLDPADGIAGKLLSGSDVDPKKHQDLFNFFMAFFDPSHPNHGKEAPDCGKAGLKPDKVKLCENAASLPPIAHIAPHMLGPIAGAGNRFTYLTANGVQDEASPADAKCTPGPNDICWATSLGYWASKNPFYDSDIITPMVSAAFAGDKGKLDSVRRLVAELKRGSQYYYVGKQAKGSQVVSYPSEWAFHRALHNQVKNVSASTFRDYAKRKAFLAKRAATFGALIGAAQSSKIGKGPDTSGDSRLAKTPPRVNGAPTGLTGAAARAARTAPVKGSAYAPSTIAGALPDKSLSRMATSPVVATAKLPLTEIDKFAWNGGKNPPQMDPSFAYPRLLCPAVDKLARGGIVAVVDKYRPGYSANVALPQDAPPNSNVYAEVGAGACHFINAILDEWARKDWPQALAPTDTTPAPQATGCFANDAACDWNPAEFMLGMEDLVHNQIVNVQHVQREADYKFCKASWNVTLGDPQYKGANASELQLLAAMKANLQIAFNSLRGTPVLEAGPASTKWSSGANRPKDHFATFGEDRHNSETWGNDLFGVGYDYNIGWELPTEWQQKPDTSWEVCDFGVGAHGKFEAFAYAFGSDKFDIIKAELAASANDATNPLVHTNANQAGLRAELDIAGDSLVSFVPPQSMVALNDSKTFTLGSGSNSWTLFEIPFQISFITLDISVGVGYQYSVDASVSPVHENDCGKPNAKPKLGLTSTIEPKGELDAIVDAYASIAGLAGVGIEIELTLLGLGLPVVNSIMFESKNNKLGLTVSSSLNMDMHTLDGSLSVYAELLFFRLFDIQILSWAGLHHTVPLFNTEATIPIGDLSKLGGTGLQNPAGQMADL